MNKVEKTVTINASVDEIWIAITTPSIMKEWYFDIPDFSIEVGATFNFYEPGDQRQFWHQCQVLEVENNRYFRHTWEHPDFCNLPSFLSWEIERDGVVSHLNLVHSQLDVFTNAGDAFKVENYDKGWDLILENLKNILELKF